MLDSEALEAFDTEKAHFEHQMRQGMLAAHERAAEGAEVVQQALAEADRGLHGAALGAMKQQRAAGESVVKQLAAEVESFNRYLGYVQHVLHEASAAERRTFEQQIETLRASQASEYARREGRREAYGMAWHGMAWHGMAWHSMLAWHGMAWHSMLA